MDLKTTVNKMHDKGYVGSREFQVCGRTATSSLEPALHSLDPSLQASFPLHHSGSSWFGVVEPPRTHSNLPCRPVSPFVTVVRGGSVGSNYPKLTPTFPVGLFPPLLQCFEKVRCIRTSPNSLEPRTSWDHCDERGGRPTGTKG